jgi:hypothetical protein
MTQKEVAAGEAGRHIDLLLAVKGIEQSRANLSGRRG